MAAKKITLADYANAVAKRKAGKKLTASDKSILKTGDKMAAAREAARKTPPKKVSTKSVMSQIYKKLKAASAPRKTPKKKYKPLTPAQSKALTAAIDKATASVKRFKELDRYRPIKLPGKTYTVQHSFAADVNAVISDPEVSDDVKAAVIEGVQNIIAASSNEYKGYPAPMLQRHIILLDDKIRRAKDAGIDLNVAPYISQKDSPEIRALLARSIPKPSGLGHDIF